MTALTEDQQIIVRAADLITSVSPAVLRGVMKNRGQASRPTMSPRALAELVDAIDRLYPNLIGLTYEDAGLKR